MAKRTVTGEPKYPVGCFTDTDAEEKQKWVSDAFERLNRGDPLSSHDHNNCRLLFREISDVQRETCRRQTLKMI